MASHNNGMLFQSINLGICRISTQGSVVSNPPQGFSLKSFKSLIDIISNSHISAEFTNLFYINQHINLWFLFHNKLIDLRNCSHFNNLILSIFLDQ